MSSYIQPFCQFRELIEDRVSTTNDTLTDCISISVPVSRSIFVFVQFSAAQTDFTAALGGYLSATFRRQSSGNVIQVGTTQSTFNRSASLITCDIQANLDNTNFLIKLQVKGKAATNINWSMSASTIIHI